WMREEVRPRGRNSRASPGRERTIRASPALQGNPQVASCRSGPVPRASRPKEAPRIPRGLDFRAAARSNPPMALAVPDQRLRHLAVRAPNWVGDLVMATPLLEAAVRDERFERVTILLRAHLAPILSGG